METKNNSYTVVSRCIKHDYFTGTEINDTFTFILCLYFVYLYNLQTRTTKYMTIVK